MIFHQMKEYLKYCFLYWFHFMKIEIVRNDLFITKCKLERK
jgi:hypothetical protein